LCRCLSAVAADIITSTTTTGAKRTM
jgi:hypothetical protein